MPRMLSQLVHRGPDDEGSMHHALGAIGMRRLSIIDVAGGHQPIASEDEQIWTVLNGEIYNFMDLRSELEAKGHRFRTRSDTEVIVHGYEEWGDRVIDRLNGIFGLAIWDAKKERVVIARDPYGIKPVYFHARSDGAVFWASEVKALFAGAGNSAEVDPLSLDIFLALRYVPSPHTLFRGIERLPPGHLLICDRAGHRVSRYFQPRRELLEDRSDDEIIELLQTTLERSVRRQMISDVPVGALLSGGADSAAIVGLMRTLTNKPVVTFTVGFKNAQNVDELADARASATYYETEHHELMLESLDYQKLLERAIWHLEEPIATSSALAMLLICELARKSVTVVLTGQGADEPHMGYVRYFAEVYGRYYRAVPTSIRRTVEPAIQALPRSERMKRAVRSVPIEDPAKRFPEVHALFSAEGRAKLWRRELRPVGTPIEELFAYWRRGTEHLPTAIQMAHVDARMSLADDLLLYGDKMSMAASIEARVPFLDLEYAQVAESLPLRARIRGLTRKAFHKRAISKWVPKWVLERRKKGFDTPIDAWFRGELRGFVREVLLDPASACRTYFEPSEVEALIAEHEKGRADHRRQLFALLTFELWYRPFILKARA
jgi:asparagine synthase (glutamine-hydrolysing)